MTRLTRELKLTVPPIHGGDVQGWARGAHRYLHDGALGEYEDQRPIVQQTFGTGKRDLCKKCQKLAGQKQTGRVDDKLMLAMSRAQAFDSLAEFQIDTYAKIHAPKLMVYPHAFGSPSSVCQGLHPTAGLNGNWAIDFCAPGGTTVVAVEDARVTRISGRNPVIFPDNLIGIWGWSIHYETSAGYRYFSTHYGRVLIDERSSVKAGDPVGLVGSWPGNPGRSHTHLGVTSPLGERDAKRRITAVSTSPRVEAST